MVSDYRRPRTLLPPEDSYVRYQMSLNSFVEGHVGRFGSNILLFWLNKTE